MPDWQTFAESRQGRNRWTVSGFSGTGGDDNPSIVGWPSSPTTFTANTYVTVNGSGSGNGLFTVYPGRVAIISRVRVKTTLSGPAICRLYINQPQDNSTGGTGWGSAYLTSSGTQYQLINGPGEAEWVFNPPLRITGWSSIQAAINSATTLTAFASIWVDAVDMTDDQVYDANQTILLVGDSNTWSTTTTVTPERLNRGLWWAFRVVDAMRVAAGPKAVRLINKGFGGLGSNTLYASIDTGYINGLRPGLIMCMVGTNDTGTPGTSKANFQQSLVRLITWRDINCPNASIMFIRPIRSKDAARTSGTVTLAIVGTWVQEIVDAYADQKVYAFDGYTAWDASEDNTMLDNQANAVHMDPRTGHERFADRIKVALQTTDFWQNTLGMGNTPF